MGNRTNSLSKSLKPTSVSRSDPSSERGQGTERVKQGTQARSTVIKVLNSPSHARTSLVAPQPAIVTELPAQQENGVNGEMALKANPAFGGEAKPLQGRPPRPPLAKPRQSKRGSIGPGSRKASQERTSSTTSTASLPNAINASVAARILHDAQESIRSYKAATCELLSDWEGSGELDTLDAFLKLDTELTNYLGRIFSLAGELDETHFSLSDIMTAGVVFLWSCRHEGENENVKLDGTIFEGKDVKYYKHVESFFHLVSKDLDFANLQHKQIEIGTVVDFRDTEFSQTVNAALTLLQQVWDKILDKTLFEDF